MTERCIEIVRPGLGGMRQPVDDDEHARRAIEALAPIVPLDATWSVVDADRLGYIDVPPAPPAPTTTDRLTAAFNQGDTT
jgi:hypothetical protein